MASVHEDTSMPWATRPMFVDASHGPALIDQLNKAHAKIRDLERRIADLHADSAHHIEDVTNNLERKVSDLFREAKQAQTREAAIRAVFLQNFEKEQEWGRKLRTFEEKMIELEKREKVVKQAEVALEARELKTEQGEALLDTKKKGLEESIWKTDNVPDKHTTSVLVKKEKRHRFMHASGDTNRLFETKDKAKHDKYDFNISFNNMNSHDIMLLRRHDYYKGWFDNAKVASQEQAIAEGAMLSTGCQHMTDINHAKNPECAGRNAGILFVGAALCQAYKSEWSICLDERKFTLQQLAIPEQHKNTPFWKGFAEGEAYIREIFWKRMAQAAKAARKE